MKKFIFSFILALTISGLTYLSMQSPEIKVFNTINTYNLKVHSIEPVVWLEKTLNTKSFLNTNIHDTAFNGVFSLFLIWLTSTFILGIKPFFSDLKTFFPIKA